MSITPKQSDWSPKYTELRDANGVLQQRTVQHTPDGPIEILYPPQEKEQYCYCGDIYRLGVIHRDDGPCHYPDHKEPEQEPVAFPRQVGDSTWTVDTAFIWRVKHTIDPDTPHDFTPSEEQIETVLLALEKIPSNLYTTPPQRKPLTDEHCIWKQQDDIHMPDTWEADCGAMWTFTEGGPKDNDMHYCPKCGKPAIEAAHGIKE